MYRIGPRRYSIGLRGIRVYFRLSRVDLGVVAENVRLAVGLTEDPRDAYRRAEARSRGLMNQGFFSALYIDHGEITNGTLQPVFDELMASWDSIQTAPPGSVGRVDAGKDARAALDRPGMGLAGYGPQTPRNPQPFRRGGSKVQSMVRMKGLEPSRLSALVPKTSVSTNSTTSACVMRQTYGFSHRAGFEVHSDSGCSCPFIREVNACILLDFAVEVKRGVTVGFFSKLLIFVNWQLKWIIRR